MAIGQTALRLIVATRLADLDSRDVLPLEVRQFVESVKLPSSALQVRIVQVYAQTTTSTQALVGQQGRNMQLCKQGV